MQPLSGSVSRPTIAKVIAAVKVEDLQAYRRSRVATRDLSNPSGYEVTQRMFLLVSSYKHNQSA